MAHSALGSYVHDLQLSSYMNEFSFEIIKIVLTLSTIPSQSIKLLLKMFLFNIQDIFTLFYIRYS